MKKMVVISALIGGTLALMLTIPYIFRLKVNL